MVWKVFISAYGENCDEHGWHTNAMEYATKELAEDAAKDLAGRWMAVKEWKVREVEQGTFTDPDHVKEVVVA